MKSEKSPKSIPEVETEIVMEASAELKEEVARELDMADPVIAQAESSMANNVVEVGSYVKVDENGGLDLYKKDRDAS